MKITLNKTQWQEIGKTAGWTKLTPAKWTPPTLICPANNCKVVGHITDEDATPYEWAAYLWDGSFLDAYDTKNEAMAECTKIAREFRKPTGSWHYVKSAASVTAGEGSALNGLSNRKARASVSSWINNHYPRGIYRDENWEPIHKFFKEIDESGVVYNLISAEYRHNEKGEPISKTWKFELPFVNDHNKPTIIYGVIIAMGAGSVARPLDAYDVTAYAF
jgi:hypothetical protein